MDVGEQGGASEQRRGNGSVTGVKSGEGERMTEVTWQSDGGDIMAE